MRQVDGSKVLGLAALVALVSACGTTVPLAGRSTTGGTLGPAGSSQQSDVSSSGAGGRGATGPSAGLTGAGAGPTGAAGPITAGAASTGGTATVTGGGPSSATGPGGSRGGGVSKLAGSGRGWDASNVYIGVVTQNDTQQVFKQFGANNVDPGDTSAMANAVAADINSHGGILGRQVKLLFDDISTVATQENGSSAGQSVCSYFTQDHPVVAVWNLSTQLDEYPTFRGCLAQAKVPLFTAAARAIDDPELSSLQPYYYHTLMVSWDKLAPVFIARLKAQNWFTGWNTLVGAPGNAPVKVGILVDGTPKGSRIASVLKQDLAIAGYPGAVSFAYSDASQGQSESSFYFKENGVTHVIVTDVELTAFQQAAAGAHYYPRFGITTYNDPYSNLEASGLTPSNSNNGALGVGWVPAFDVSQSNDPGLTPGGAHCLQVMQKANQAVGGPKRLAEAYAFSLCDSLYLIAKGAAAAGGFTAGQLYSGIMRVGPAFDQANGFAPALTPAEPYVPGAVRDLEWNSSCGCMKYGPVITRL
jgi:hypothetical protein